MEEVEFPRLYWDIANEMVLNFKLMYHNPSDGRALIREYFINLVQDNDDIRDDVADFWTKDAPATPDIQKGCLTHLMNTILLVPVGPDVNRRCIFPENASPEQLLVRKAELDLGVNLLKDSPSLHKRQARTSGALPREYVQ